MGIRRSLRHEQIHIDARHHKRSPDVANGLAHVRVHRRHSRFRFQRPELRAVIIHRGPSRPPDNDDDPTRQHAHAVQRRVQRTGAREFLNVMRDSALPSSRVGAADRIT